MRKISILNEDYLQLQEACGKATKKSKKKKSEKEENVAAAIKYLKENAENEGTIYEFIYNEAVEELLNMDLVEGFAEITRKIKNSNYLSLDESIELAHSVNKELNNDSKDDCESIKNLFSDKGVDIPECKGEECFRVTPNAVGKMEAIKKLQNLTLKAENIQDQTKKCIKNADNANALDYLKLEENLHYLANIKVLFETAERDEYLNLNKKERAEFTNDLARAATNDWNPEKVQAGSVGKLMKARKLSYQQTDHILKKAKDQADAEKQQTQYFLYNSPEAKADFKKKYPNWDKNIKTAEAEKEKRRAEYDANKEKYDNYFNTAMKNMNPKK